MNALILPLCFAVALASYRSQPQQAAGFDQNFGSRPSFGAQPSGGQPFGGQSFGGQSLGGGQPFGGEQIQTSFSLGGGSTRPSLPVAPAGLPGPARSQDCVTQPGPWSVCSKSCGGGLRRRSLIIVTPAKGYGAKCPQLHDEIENCNSQPCPIDCEVEQGSYSECSATCGVGYRTKVDIIIRESRYGGLACPPPESLVTRVECQLPPCPVPVHCEVEWGQYGECSAQCGLGVKTRSAVIVRQPENGGAPCPDASKLVEQVACLERPCQEEYDCLYIQSEWSQCGATCGPAYRQRRIYIIAQPTPGGAPCPSDLVEQQRCNLPPCVPPQDCEVEWGSWTACSATCGGGTQSLFGRIIRQNANGGVPCPSPYQLRQTRSCGNGQCGSLVAECEVVYGELSECSASCGGGYQFQKGWIKTEAVGAQPCPNPDSLFRQVECNSVPCPVKVDCQVQRSYWSECSVTCGGGSQSRTLQIVQQSQNGGLPCPSRLVESRPCNSEPCNNGGGYRRFQ